MRPDPGARRSPARASARARPCSACRSAEHRSCHGRFERDRRNVRRFVRNVRDVRYNRRIRVAIALPLLLFAGCAASDALLSIQQEQVGFYEGVLRSVAIQEHMERQTRAMWMLRWIPWILFGLAGLFAIVLGRRWKRWSAMRVRRSVGILLGAGIALPLASTLISVYPLFFTLDRPAANDIGAAITEALNALAFGVLLDGVVLLLFLFARLVR